MEIFTDFKSVSPGNPLPLCPSFRQMAQLEGRGGATWRCSGFLWRPQGNFTVSGDFDVLQVKEKSILKFLAGGTHFGDTYLDCRMEQYVYI